MSESIPIKRPLDPRAEYQKKLAESRELEKTLDRRDATLANLRFVVFLTGVGLGWWIWNFGKVASGWLAIPVGAFLLLVILQSRAARRRRVAVRDAAFCERGLARVEERWAGHGRQGLKYFDPEHPYAADLDLFGRGSLFERISTAHSAQGEELLAGWLTAPAAIETLERRREAVRELAPMLDFRREFAGRGESVRDGMDFAGLCEWSQRSEPLALDLLGPAAILLAAVTTITLLAWGFSDLGPWPFFIAAIAQGFFAFALMNKTSRSLEELDRRSEGLNRLAESFRLVETGTFTSALLRELQSVLTGGTATASAEIGRLAAIVDRLSWRKNMIFAPISILWLWGTQTGFAVERWRRATGEKVSAWIESAAEIEALASLASYTFENPGDPFPDLIDSGDPRIECEGLGHPLLPVQSCVRNDVRLGGELRALIVSGSNMSGKSTLLRSVGANVVLALAGGPAKCTRMALTPMMIGATLRVQDSLQEGKSRFYAEILRIRQVVDLASKPLPLLFLLDEVLHGTNSHDRLQGAASIVKGLIAKGAIGLVTTHDLALAEVAEKLAPQAMNVHFEDRMEAGVMHFDYRMKPGVVRNSNALELMRAVGLDV